MKAVLAQAGSMCSKKSGGCGKSGMEIFACAQALTPPSQGATIQQTCAFYNGFHSCVGTCDVPAAMAPMTAGLANVSSMCSNKTGGTCTDDNAKLAKDSMG